MFFLLCFGARSNALDIAVGDSVQLGALNGTTGILSTGTWTWVFALLTVLHPHCTQGRSCGFQFGDFTQDEVEELYSVETIALEVYLCV